MLDYETLRVFENARPLLGGVPTVVAGSSRWIKLSGLLSRLAIRVSTQCCDQLGHLCIAIIGMMVITPLPHLIYGRPCGA